MWAVVILEKPRASLRGYCRRFLIEPASNIFVGKTNKVLFEDLTEKIKQSGINATIIHDSRKSDLGFRAIVFGNPARQIVDLGGFQAILRKNKEID